MAITQCITNVAKQFLLGNPSGFSNAPDWSSSSGWSIALIDGSVDVGPTTASINTGIGELAATGGYTSKTIALTTTQDATTGTVMADFADASWTSASFTASGAIIYAGVGAKYGVVVLDFGGPKTVSSGTFTVTFPNADINNAIVRLT
tara:strand:- start:407 stop:850 length:444 start_codon:yes stop_codon:yes gene_type:complete